MKGGTKCTSRESNPGLYRGRATCAVVMFYKSLNAVQFNDAIPAENCRRQLTSNLQHDLNLSKAMRSCKQFTNKGTQTRSPYSKGVPKRRLQEATPPSVRAQRSQDWTFARQLPLRGETARQRPQEGEITIVVGLAKAGLGFHPSLATCESTDDVPMLHHHSNSADMWGPCTDAPRRPTFVRRRPRHTHRQLHHAPRSPLPPPAAPLAPSRPPLPDAPLAPIRPPSIGHASHAKPDSISAARASRAEPASAAIGCTTLRQAGLRPLLQTMLRRHGRRKPAAVAAAAVTSHRRQQPPSQNRRHLQRSRPDAVAMRGGGGGGQIGLQHAWIRPPSLASPPDPPAVISLAATSIPAAGAPSPFPTPSPPPPAATNCRRQPAIFNPRRHHHQLPPPPQADPPPAASPPDPAAAARIWVAFAVSRGPPPPTGEADEGDEAPPPPFLWPRGFASGGEAAERGRGERRCRRFPPPMSPVREDDAGASRQCMISY
uniref:Uncharacterized protein n=1 Tax=Oryza sativa subsp. japonica TaxID=39947 RepID=Q6H8D1_ORYSJ|nr:hypothetical protein [Oryza sativa Japonica Group]